MRVRNSCSASYADQSNHCWAACNQQRTKELTGDESQQDPIGALQRAVENTATAFLRRRPVTRFLVGGLGALSFVLGALLAPFSDVPLFSWLYVYQLSAPALAAGLSALRVWHLSRPNSRSGRLDGALRAVVRLVGVVLLAAGAVAFMLQHVPGLTWVKGAIASCVAGGLGALGICYLSDRVSRRPTDLGGHLSRLAELHASGALTDEEFARAKSRVLA